MEQQAAAASTSNAGLVHAHTRVLHYNYHYQLPPLYDYSYHYYSSSSYSFCCCRCFSSYFYDSLPSIVLLHLPPTSRMTTSVNVSNILYRLGLSYIFGHAQYQLGARSISHLLGSTKT